MQQGINGQAGFSQNFESVDPAFVMPFVIYLGIRLNAYSTKIIRRLFLFAAFWYFFVLVM
jgi:hypothetical protein